MTLLIIDNEPIIREGIVALLQAYCESITEIHEADGVQSGLKAIAQYKPDIVLLDVEMDDGTGFELVQQLNHPAFQLIFITAHNKYAIDAFRCAAIDFLLKPVDPQQLQESIGRAQKQIEQQNLSEQLAVMLKQYMHRRDPDQKIVLKDINSTYFVKVQDILFCEADGTYTKFYFTNNSSILVSKNLKEYEAVLEPFGFIRTHHSYLANPLHIRLFDKTDGGSLVFEGGLSIPVSQRKKDYVLQRLETR
ncbi:LytR/AlgR family response regulator transcription factor [Phnomibacter ginsenosidimutans]|uniref:Response regulator n=1 Tax=Phnomibacter ginsenosidimutans TaxID=2676868 RepID=A0A6I6G7D7_9BACT|nr:LytTR family DNA-binding domain-containing protein [Phnomibacter ginsenosidimutans]QGW28084.1 response regulator [Phnomibacter ginsenosidimutans]